MRTNFPASGSTRCETAVDTRAFGEELGAALDAGDMVILDGPLGAGKTTLTQGIAAGLGVQGRVTSPTFIIAREHPSASDGPALVHVDAYRLVGDEGSADPIGELDALDLDTELTEAVVVAEWGGGFVEQLTDAFLLVQLDRTTAVEENPDSEARLISWAMHNRAGKS